MRKLQPCTLTTECTIGIIGVINRAFLLEIEIVIEIDTVLIKVASRCNINCRYCYVYNMGDTRWADMPKQMSVETVLAVACALDALSRQQRRRFAVVLHGGEPLLIGPEKLTFLLARLRDVLSTEYPFSVQTNGMLISQAVLDVCSEFRTSLGVSIDGPRGIHDRHRIDHAGQGTHDKVLEGIARLQNHPDGRFLYAGLLAVIDPTSDPSEVYGYFKELGAPSVDFLYRDGNHSQLPYGKASFQSAEYGRWLSRLLDVYLADPTPIRIRLLDDMIKLILGGSGTKEGLGPTDFGIVVIDTDGSVTKNDTLKSSFNGADCFQQQWSVHTHRLADIANSPEFASYHALQRPSASCCLSCPELAVCGGGMPVNRWRNENGYENPSVYCADQLVLIRHMRDRLASFVESCR